MKLRTRRRARVAFWTLAQHFQRRDSEWSPVNAAFESWGEFTAGGVKWQLCLKAHIARTAPDGAGRTGLDYSSSVTLWPPPELKGSEAVLGKRGWYEAVERTLRRKGYRGDWKPSPYGRCGDFWRNARSAGALAKESERLPEILSALSRVRV